MPRSHRPIARTRTTWRALTAGGLLALVIAGSVRAQAPEPGPPAPAGAPAPGVEPAAPIKPATGAPSAEPAQGTVLRARLDWLVSMLMGEEAAFLSRPLGATFLGTVTPSQLQAQVADARARSGGFEVVRRRTISDRSAAVILRALNGGGEWSATITLEPTEAQLIGAMSIEPVAPTAALAYPGWAVLDADMERLGFPASMVALELLPGGAVAQLHELRGGETMAVGTAGWMWIVGALAQACEAGSARWDDVRAIDAETKLPIDSPTTFARAGEEVALAELARRTLVLVDASAAQHLFVAMGREAIERHAQGALGGRATPLVKEDPEGARDPFLSPKEFYQLKCSIDPALLTQFAQSPPAGRRALLEGQVSRTLVVPEFAMTWAKPQQLDRVGYFASADALARQAARLWALGAQPAHTPLASALAQPTLTPGDAARWRRMAALSGGEPGAVAATWILERHDARTFVVVFVFNRGSGAVQMRVVSSLVAATLGLVAELPEPAQPR